MNCEDCKNKSYCEPFKNNDDMRGCGSGIPEFLPFAVAEIVVRKVNRAVEEMGFDREEYSNKVIEAVKNALSA